MRENIEYEVKFERCWLQNSHCAHTVGGQRGGKKKRRKTNSETCEVRALMARGLPLCTHCKLTTWQKKEGKTNSGAHLSGNHPLLLCSKSGILRRLSTVLLNEILMKDMLVMFSPLKRPTNSFSNVGAPRFNKYRTRNIGMRTHHIVDVSCKPCFVVCTSHFILLAPASDCAGRFCDQSTSRATRPPM